MTYMEQFQQQQIQQAYDQFRPDFAAKLFPDGLEDASALALRLSGLFFPGTDCVCGHYQTCFDFFSTYAFSRLMGYNEEYAELSCKNKYSTLTPITLHMAVELCGAQLKKAFPTL